MNEIDKSVLDGVALLRQIFCGLKLTPEEKTSVNEAAKKIAAFSYDVFESLPQEQSQELRSIVMVVAIACLIGPPDSDYGVDVLLKKTKT